MIYTVALTNILNFFLMVLITYNWLNYVLAVLQTPGRNRRRFKRTTAMPLAISFLVFIIVYFRAPQLLVDSNLDTTRFYDAFQVALPDVYVLAALYYSFKEARNARDRVERRSYLVLGLFPVSLIIAGLVQILLLPESAVFCLASAILMVSFYIDSMDSQISQDPLTRLNNRGQLRRYAHQDSNLFRDDTDTYIFMLDINGFKKINDTYGHAEGDRALVLTADALRKAVSSMESRIFICRYGGDEFTLVMHTDGSETPDALAGKVHEAIDESCKTADLPYKLEMGIGWDKLEREGDSAQKCIARADRKLYEAKAAAEMLR
jgi:diguanylate cyclase (GGDEF)-like protein